MQCLIKMSTYDTYKYLFKNSGERPKFLMTLAWKCNKLDRNPYISAFLQHAINMALKKRNVETLLNVNPNSERENVP